jgi:hypothetical protein
MNLHCPRWSSLKGLAGSQYYERPLDVARYRESIDYMRDSALSPRDSVQCLVEMHKAYDIDSSALDPGGRR